MRRWLQNLAEENEIIIYHKKTQITRPIMQSLKVKNKIIANKFTRIRDSRCKNVINIEAWAVKLI